MTVDDLKELFGVRDDQDLCPILGRKKAAVSSWRKTGVPASIERLAIRKADKNEVPKKEKPDQSPLEEAFVGFFRRLSVDEQTAELKRLIDRFSAERPKERP